MKKTILLLHLIIIHSMVFSQKQWISEKEKVAFKCPIDTVYGVLIWHDTSKWRQGTGQQMDSGYWVGRWCRTETVFSGQLEQSMMFFPGTVHYTGRLDINGKRTYTPHRWEYDQGQGGSFYTKKKTKVPSTDVYGLLVVYPKLEPIYSSGTDVFNSGRITVIKTISDSASQKIDTSLVRLKPF